MRFGRWPRRILAGSFVLLAVLAQFAAGPTPTSEVPVVVASRDLAPGTELRAGDIRLDHWPARIAPQRRLPSLAEATGKRLVGEVGDGEAITTSRIVPHDLTKLLPPGQVAVAVSVQTRTIATLVHIGSYVDLIAPTESQVTGTSGVHVARGARVLLLTEISQDARVGGGATELVIAVSPEAALKIAGASSDSLLASLANPP